jgi:hypothetical protein
MPEGMLACAEIHLTSSWYSELVAKGGIEPPTQGFQSAQ